MFKKILALITGRSATAPTAEAAYKVEAPQTPVIVEAPVVAEAPAKETPAKKPAAKKAAAAKKPEAKKPATPAAK